MNSWDAFSRVENSKRASGKTAYIIGSGLAGLAAAYFLIHDEGMKGSSIHLFETVSGSSESMRYPYFPDSVPSGNDDALWAMFSNVPSLENESISVLDDFHKFNSSSGKNPAFDYTLSSSAWRELLLLILEKDEALEGKKIESLVSDAVTSSHFFNALTCLSGINKNDSALELKLLLKHYGLDISSYLDYSVFKFPRYNFEESAVLPLINYLKDNSVIFESGTLVEDVRFEKDKRVNRAVSLTLQKDNEVFNIGLDDTDLVFITLGNRFENPTSGSDSKAAKPDTELKEGSLFLLWNRIARENPEFGNPSLFTSGRNPAFLPVMVTTESPEVISLIEKNTGTNPYNGKTVTGKAIGEKDSSWLINWFIPRQPYFRRQKGEEIVAFLYGLNPTERGNYVKKSMYESSGHDIASEWLYHLGAGTDSCTLASACHAVPLCFPFFHSPLVAGKEKKVPRAFDCSYSNFAFIGEYASLEGVSTVRQEGQIAVAEFCVKSLIEPLHEHKIADGFSVSSLLSMRQYLLSGKKLDQRTMNLKERTLCKAILKALSGTDLERLAEEYQVIDKPSKKV